MKKALVLWSLLLVLALLAGCGSQAADNGNDTPNNDAVTDSQDNAPADAPANTPADSAPVDYPALFERARISDGAASEDVANQLVKAYDSDAAGLLSAMAEYPAEDVELLAWLLVYGKSYGDLDAFQQDIRQRAQIASRSGSDYLCLDILGEHLLDVNFYLRVLLLIHFLCHLHGCNIKGRIPGPDGQLFVCFRSRKTAQRQEHAERQGKSKQFLHGIDASFIQMKLENSCR